VISGLTSSWHGGHESTGALYAVAVGDQVRQWVLEFLDANELGLGFQTLVEALVENRAHVSERALERLAPASRELGLEADPGCRRLSERPTTGDGP
jgi:hypothetical protein